MSHSRSFQPSADTSAVTAGDATMSDATMSRGGLVHRPHHPPIPPWHVAWAIIGVVVGTIVGTAAGLAALLATASVTTNPMVFLFAGATAFAVLVFAGAVIGTAGVRRRARVVAYPVSGLVVAGLVAGLLWPMGDPQHPPALVADREVADLSTGSRLAYAAVEAEAETKEDRQPLPVVILHGGPGVPNMAGDIEYFGRLAQDGFDVYVYDQVGSGYSGRLADPTEYGLAHDVADLEAFRREVIGARQLILVGRSSGARLATAYVARHGNRVNRVVLTSPGDLAPDAGGANLFGRLGLQDRATVLGLTLHPRAQIAYALLQVDARAAHAYVGDAELDARFDRLYAASRPALHCGDADKGRALRGLGFFANQYPQSWPYPTPEDDRPALAERNVPTLVVKGSCDYLSWSSAIEYRDTIPEAELVYLRGAGHNVAADQPGRYLALVRAFLSERPLPVNPYTRDAPPPGYEGPR